MVIGIEQKEVSRKKFIIVVSDVRRVDIFDL